MTNFPNILNFLSHCNSVYNFNGNRLWRLSMEKEINALISKGTCDCLKMAIIILVVDLNIIKLLGLSKRVYADLWCRPLLKPSQVAWLNLIMIVFLDLGSKGQRLIHFPCTQRISIPNHQIILKICCLKCAYYTTFYGIRSSYFRQPCDGAGCMTVKCLSDT